jgi:SPP1 gp7 family putative phage head morphogenesis protein
MCKLQTLSETSTPSQKLRAFYNIDSDREDDFRKRINAFDNAAQEENYLFNVWAGIVTPLNLDVGLYERTASLYVKAIDSIKASKGLTFYNEFKQSTWLFSGAKSFRSTVELNLLLTTSDGKLRTFNEFKELAKPKIKEFHQNYLKTEYNAAVANTQSAVQWDTIQKDKEFFPSLRYITTGDARVRQDHAELDNIIRPVDDPFWDTYMPINDWGCRCSVQQVTTKQKTDLRKKKLSELPPAFRNNPGKSRKMFTQNHPYFDVPKPLEAFKKSNFGLPLPAQDIPERVLDNG